MSCAGRDCRRGIPVSLCPSRSLTLLSSSLQVNTAHSGPLLSLPLSWQWDERGHLWWGEECLPRLTDKESFPNWGSCQAKSIGVHPVETRLPHTLRLGHRTALQQADRAADTELGLRASTARGRNGLQGPEFRAGSSSLISFLRSLCSVAFSFNSLCGKFSSVYTSEVSRLMNTCIPISQFQQLSTHVHVFFFIHPSPCAEPRLFLWRLST